MSDGDSNAETAQLPAGVDLENAYTDISKSVTAGGRGIPPLHRNVGLCGLENLDTLRLRGCEELFIKRCHICAACAGAMDIGRIVARDAIALGDSDYICEDLPVHR